MVLPYYDQCPDRDALLKISYFVTQAVSVSDGAEVQQLKREREGCRERVGGREGGREREGGSQLSNSNTRSDNHKGIEQRSDNDKLSNI